MFQCGPLITYGACSLFLPIEKPHDGTHVSSYIRAYTTRVHGVDGNTAALRLEQSSQGLDMHYIGELGLAVCTEKAMECDVGQGE
jgi:hypothetical protein